MLSRILTKEQQRLLSDERQALNRLQIALSRFDSSEEDRQVLERSVLQLDELFLIVIVGEFNAGKSAFINALLGERLLEEGVTPTTSRIHLVQHGSAVERTSNGPLGVLTAPVELLQEINFVDTPGTNAILREHEQITAEFVPRSDLVLFVTSADRPFTESERSFMEKIKGWGKKIVIVINKVDIFSEPSEIEHVESYVAQNVEKLLGFAPVIFTVAARDTLKAKAEGRSSTISGNRFADLEKYIVSTLDQVERIRLKLGNPVGVGIRLITRYHEMIEARLDLLKEDRETIEKIETRLAGYREEMARDFRYRLADVDNVLHDFENRGMDFFDDHIRLARFLDLMNKNRVKQAFAREVVSDMPQVIERRVGEIIDWMVTSDLGLWQSVVDQLRRRRSQEADAVISKVGEEFQYNRDRLLQTVGHAAQRAAATFDKDAEASRISEDVQLAVAGTALAEIGAVGLGTLVTAVATSAAVDVTGILAASVIAVVGLFVLPSKRRDAKKDLSDKVASVRKKLMKALTEQFDREIDRTLERVRESLAPYTGFVAKEHDVFQKSQTELNGLLLELTDLQKRIDAI